MNRSLPVALALSLLAIPATAQSLAPAPPAPAVPRAVRPATAPRAQLDVTRTRPLGGRGYLGVSLVDLTPELRQHYGAPKEAGLLVSRVTADSPAGRAGIRVGDIITAIDGSPVTGAFEVGRLVRKHKGGEQVAVDLVRNGAKQKYSATVAEREARVIELESLEDLPLMIGEQGAEIAARIEKTVNSPEFRAKIARVRDCADSTAKIEAMERRLAELEKKLAKQ